MKPSSNFNDNKKHKKLRLLFSAFFAFTLTGLGLAKPATVSELNPPPIEESTRGMSDEFVKCRKIYDKITSMNQSAQSLLRPYHEGFNKLGSLTTMCNQKNQQIQSLFNSPEFQEYINTTNNASDIALQALEDATSCLSGITDTNVPQEIINKANTDYKLAQSYKDELEKIYESALELIQQALDCYNEVIPDAQALQSQAGILNYHERQLSSIASQAEKLIKTLQQNKNDPAFVSNMLHELEDLLAKAEKTYVGTESAFYSKASDSGLNPAFQAQTSDSKSLFQAIASGSDSDSALHAPASDSKSKAQTNHISSSLTTVLNRLRDAYKQQVPILDEVQSLVAQAPTIAEQANALNEDNMLTIESKINYGASEAPADGSIIRWAPNVICGHNYGPAQEFRNLKEGDFVLIKDTQTLGQVKCSFNSAKGIYYEGLILNERFDLTRDLYLITCDGDANSLEEPQNAHYTIIEILSSQQAREIFYEALFEGLNTTLIDSFHNTETDGPLAMHLLFQDSPYNETILKYYRSIVNTFVRDYNERHYPTQIVFNENNGLTMEYPVTVKEETYVPMNNTDYDERNVPEFVNGIVFDNQAPKDESLDR